MLACRAGLRDSLKDLSSPAEGRASALLSPHLPVPAHRRDRYIRRMAGRQGFEPRYADPESAVLPLDDLPLHLSFLPVSAGFVQLKMGRRLPLHAAERTSSPVIPRADVLHRSEESASASHKNRSEFTLNPFSHFAGSGPFASGGERNDGEQMSFQQGLRCNPTPLANKLQLGLGGRNH